MYCLRDEIKIELCKVYFHVGESREWFYRKEMMQPLLIMKNGDDLCKTGEIAKYYAL